MKQSAMKFLFIVALLQPFTFPDSGFSDNYHRTNRGKWLGQPATAQGVIPTSAGLDFSTITTKRRLLQRVTLQNRGTGASAAALVALLADNTWEAGQWVHATTTYTADTTDAQDADTNDFALETTTVDDGFIVGADRVFGAVSIDTTTGGSGTTTTHVVEYWNGSAWTAVAAAGMLSDVARSADWATGENLILFTPQPDWAVGGSGTGVSTTRYNLRVRRTNATQATAALARRIYVGEVITSIDALAANAEINREYRLGLFIPSYWLRLSGAFATADEGNAIEIDAE